MDALKLRQIFEKLDQALEHPTELPARFKADPVVEDNLRFVMEDLL